MTEAGFVLGKRRWRSSGGIRRYGRVSVSGREGINLSLRYRG